MSTYLEHPLKRLLALVLGLVAADGVHHGRGAAHKHQGFVTGRGHVGLQHGLGDIPHPTLPLAAAGLVHNVMYLKKGGGKGEEEQNGPCT